MDLSGFLGGVFQDYIALHLVLFSGSGWNWRAWPPLTEAPGYPVTGRSGWHAWSWSLADHDGRRPRILPP